MKKFAKTTIADRKGASTLKKNAAVLKKNIFGYYQDPQFHNNQPSLTVTKHPNLNKAIQTVPEDLSIMSVRPVIKLTIIDGRFKPRRNRHRIDFYVKLNYNMELALSMSTLVKHMNANPNKDDIHHTLEVVWNQEFLISGYSFPFFSLDVMNKTKGLRDLSIAAGKFPVTKTTIPRSVNVKDEKG